MKKLLVIGIVALLAIVVAVVCVRKDLAEPVKAPTRVKLAHIMLEKEQLPEELDAASAMKLVSERKKRERLLAIEREELKKAMAREDFRCAVPVTLLRKKKGNKQ